MTEKEELAFMEGEKSFARRILREAASTIGGEKLTEANWKLERASAISQLREMCREFGDNDWKDTLYLSDILEKHLYRHLAE